MHEKHAKHSIRLGSRSLMSKISMSQVSKIGIREVKKNSFSLTVQYTTVQLSSVHALALSSDTGTNEWLFIKQTNTRV